MAGTGSIYKSDLFNLHNIIQVDAISYPKEYIIGLLRDIFSEDSYYRYVRDPWGFPLTPDHTDLPLTAGITDDTTTRIYIGEKYRYDAIFYPAVLVSHGGTRSTPISINREQDCVINSTSVVADGYGNVRYYYTPAYFVKAGAWEGSINIDVMAKGIRERDDITELIMITGEELKRNVLLKAGIFIKSISSSAGSEQDDRNDKIYKNTITFEIRTEWRRQIPIEDLVDAINICVDFGRVDTNPPVVAPNMQVNIELNIVDSINEILLGE